MSIILAAFVFIPALYSQTDSSVGGRKIGVQCYTFRRNTLEETVKMLKSTPVRVLEAWGGQKTGLGIDKKFNPDLTQEECAKVAEFIRENGFSLNGISAQAKTREEAEKLFEFARYFGIKEITSEPTGEMVNIFDELSKKTGVKVAFHNHDNEGKNNFYYNPYELLRTIEGTSITAVPDTGNYARAGVDTIAALKVLKGKISSIHLKDISKFGMYTRGKSVAYGKGIMNVAEVLRELDSQGFDGYIYLEAGEQAKKPMEYVLDSLKFLEKHPKMAIDAKPRKIAVQTMPFRRSYTLEDTFSIIRKNDVDYAQCYPRQIVSEDLNFEFSPDMPRERWEDVKRTIESSGVKIIGYGPINAFTEADAEKIFAFLKYFEIPEVITESTGEGLKAMGKMSLKTGIRTGIRSRIKNPATNKYYGARILTKLMRENPGCLAAPDTELWGRSGIDSVKSLRYLKGNISSITLKNVAVFDKMSGNPVVDYESGEINIPAILEELDSQNFDGYIVINPPEENTMDILSECVEFLGKHPAKLKSFADRKIAVQGYTFRKFSVEKTGEIMRKLGVENIELFPGQRAFENSDEKLSHKAPKEDWKKFSDMLKSAGIRAVSYGVTNSTTPEEAERIAEFAAALGIGQIITENTGENLSILAQKAKEKGIKVGIHHHAKDSKKNKYYDPNVMAETVSSTDNAYANPDIGHWARCGTDPIEALRKLDGKILSVHIKDHSKFGDLNSKCTAFGEGDLNLPEILAELDRQGFDGYYVLENEHIPNSPYETLEKCIDYLHAKPIGKAYFKTPRKIALQTYSFGNLPFDEALDKINTLNIDTLEAYGRQGFGQILTSGEKVKFGYDMPKELWRGAKKLVEERNMQIKFVGTLSPKTEEEARRLFEFARVMGADTINTEVVGDERWTFMNKLAKEFGMHITVHNHALKISAQSKYYMPEVVKALTEKYDRLKVCPDNGHWARAGVDNVEALKKLRGRIGNIHLKDMTAFGDMNAKSVVYGRGALNISEILGELDRQGFDGYCIIEYEGDRKVAFESVRACKELLMLSPTRD